MGYVFVLATLMAVFAILGYRFGTRSAVLTAAVVWVGLLLIARAGGSIAKLVNGLYFGIRFVLAGGVPALGGTGDRAAAIGKVIQGMGPVKLLIPTESRGPELAIVLGVLILIAVLLGMTDRLSGPTSHLGLVLGLTNGYLIGAFLLDSLVPTLGLPLPFGLGIPRATVPAGGAGTSLAGQATRWVQTANEQTLAWIVMLVIALFLIGAIRMGNRGTKAR